MRVVEIYASSEDFLKHLNELDDAEDEHLMRRLEITSVSIYGSP